MAFYAIDDHVAEADITTTAASPAQMQPINLRSPHVGVFFRALDLAPGATRVTLDFQLSEAKTARYFFMQRPRMSLEAERKKPPSLIATDRARVRFYSDAPGGAVVGDSGEAAMNMALATGTWGYFLPADVSYRAVRLEIDALSRSEAPDNNMDLGRVSFGPAHVFEVSYKRRADGIGSNSTTKRPAAGARLYRRQGEHWRLWNVLFRSIRNEIARDQLREFVHLTYGALPFVFGFNETNPQTEWMYAAHLNPNLDALSRNFSALPLSLEEAL